MKTKLIYTLAIIGLFSIAILTGVLLSSGDKDNDWLNKSNESEFWTYLNKTDFEYKPRLVLKPIEIITDYSKEGYFKVTPESGKEFYFLECVNSTILIEENKIGCVSELSQKPEGDSK